MNNYISACPHRTATPAPELLRITHLIELIQLVKLSKSFVGDSRFSTLSDGRRVQVSA